MGSEGEGGTPKPTALRTFPAFRPATVQNPLPAPVVPAADPVPSVAEVGFATTAAQGQTGSNPSKSRLN